ncbi:GNAT family N-acetyltransferase [Butyrivibrio sp. FC2001]|uniref:GNAT family N-acetyltransferase n=1 Tax=Butyrivibrio sp. FC2001 TaxID=1280671 RepID=UPI0004132748|nr:GNAT family N-acetyltransferase [Butyrivibrio sp. FC2001]
MITLRKPIKKYESEAMAFKQEFLNNGEPVINGSELLDQMESYDEWLKSVTDNTSSETVSPSWVVTDTYFAFDDNDRLVGIIDLRHELNDFLKDFGNCGYSVRPSERRKGYATQMLELVIWRAAEVGMDKLQLSVEKSNTASIKTITKNGGKYARSFTFEGEEADVYFIDIEKKRKSTVILYVHGKGGSADEACHYKSLFPDMDIFGLDYKTDSPWETNKEIEKTVAILKKKYTRIILIANSIGAFYSMNADICKSIDHAFFISPMADMETLISNMMTWANVSEDDLKREKVIKTDFGEDLSWEYLCYVRDNPINWTVPTDILYGSADHLQSFESIKKFADRTGASLTVLKDGEHWFHTEDQMKFLDEWITKIEY